MAVSLITCTWVLQEWLLESNISFHASEVCWLYLALASDNITTTISAFITTTTFSSYVCQPNILFNKVILDSFSLWSWTRQGCPTFPVIFIIVLQILTTQLNQTILNISRNNNLKCNLYEDVSIPYLKKT